MSIFIYLLMSGGLLQIASIGKQDIYLTKKPQITFFKKIYKRYTNFSMETSEITIENTPNYGEDFFIIVPKQAHLLYRCFFEIEIPAININDDYIDNTNYKKQKNTILKNISIERDKWKREYDTLSEFANIQLEFYQKILNLMKSENINYQNILHETLIFKASYKNNLEKSIFKIDEDIKNNIDIISFVSNFEFIFSDTDDLDNNKITYNTFLNKLESIYQKIINELNYYFSNYIYYKKKYDKTNLGKINFSWINKLAHHYFTNFEIELGGRIPQQYSNHYLNIFQDHHLFDYQENNYKELIGDTLNLTQLDSTKEFTKIYTPLIFWFNNKPNQALPLCALQNDEIKLNFKINQLSNLINFFDFQLEFDNLKTIYIHKLSHQLNGKYAKKFNLKINGKEQIIDKNIEYLPDEKIYVYYLDKLTKGSLKTKFPQLNDNDLDYLFEKYSNGFDISLENYIKFRLSQDNKLSQLSSTILYQDFHQFSDYNFLENEIGHPRIKFFAEYIYLDETESHKFATNKLEYIINIPREITFDINNVPLFTTDLTLLKPTKDIIWYLYPKLNQFGYKKYHKKNTNLYNFFMLYPNVTIFNKLQITSNEFKLIDMNPNNQNQYLYSNKLKLNKSNLQYYYHSQSLYPEEEQPSGTINFSPIKGKQLLLELNPEFLNLYFDEKINPNQENIEFNIIYRYYNLFIINKGKSRILFA